MTGEIIAQAAAGRLRGSRDGDALRFLGIPYAQAPAIAGRFAAPAAVPRWDGVRDATSYGATSPQPDRGVTIIPEPIIGGDNELNLNVYTPELGASGLPVLVWIHGGGYFGGGNSSPWYQGQAFARDGVVLVTINYRLGAAGFLELPDAPANRGVRDWVAALTWVQDNIAAFGGDPAKVTIAGQSAGGGACATLLAVPAARSLFRSAICMSGGASLVQTEDGVRSVAHQMAGQLGVPLRQADFSALSPDRIIEAQQVIMSDRARPRDRDSVLDALRGIRLPFAPWADGEVVTQDPWDAVQSPDTPLLIGATASEFSMGWLAEDWITADLVTAGLAGAGMPPGQLGGYLAVQGAKRPCEIVGQAMTDRTFRVPAQEMAAAKASAGGAVYVYDFRWPSPAEQFRGLSIHCLDVPFVFDVLDQPGVREVAGDEPPPGLAREMHGAWVRFVTTGEPGWQQYETGTRQVMVFGETSAPAADPLRAERMAWSEVVRSPG